MVVESVVTDSGIDFAPDMALRELLSDCGIPPDAAGGTVEFVGADPVVAARHRLGACVGLPIMGNAVAAAAVHRLRGGAAQDLRLDLRQAVHQIAPDAFWQPTVAGYAPSSSLLIDNPYLLEPYRTADGRWIMACGVYPHLAAEWCRFLDVPPDGRRVAEAIGTWKAGELEDAANARGLPASVVRTPDEWASHPQGSLLSGTPVIGLTRIGDALPRSLGPASRPFDGVRVLSLTHAIAGPVVGRTMAEHGADVLCVTRPNDFEHDLIYSQANVGSRSVNLDLNSGDARAEFDRLVTTAHVVVNNHRQGKLERLGVEPERLARDHPGIIVVSITCYGGNGPWAARGGFDMNASAVSGLMYREGWPGVPTLPPTGMINDFITGYLGALGATAALRKQLTEGGSWHVTVSLTRSAMWCGALGLVDPAVAGTANAHRLQEPRAYDAHTPLGDVHMLAPPVVFSRTQPRWRDPVLVPKGSSSPQWCSAADIGAS